MHHNQISLGNRGRVDIVVEIHGEPTHSSVADELGRNPIPVVADTAQKGDIDITESALGTVTSLATAAPVPGATVRVEGKSGQGGRNQQFALYCAPKISGENLCVLSAGTDGIDGNSPAAGAIVDGST